MSTQLRVRELSRRITQSIESTHWNLFISADVASCTLASTCANIHLETEQQAKVKQENLPHLNNSQLAMQGIERTCCAVCVCVHFVLTVLHCCPVEVDCATSKDQRVISIDCWKIGVTTWQGKKCFVDPSGYFMMHFANCQILQHFDNNSWGKDVFCKFSLVQ